MTPAKVGLGVVALVLWISFLQLPVYVSGAVGDPPLQYAEGADETYQVATGYALVHRWQAGSDYLLNYGPLGYFAVRVYDPALFWPRYVWELATKLVLALLVLALIRSLPGTLPRVLLGVVALVLLPRAPAAMDLFLVLATGMALLRSRTDRPLPLVAGLGFLAVLSLCKFTLFLLALVAVTLLSAKFLAKPWGRLGRAASGALPPLVFAAFLGATWVLLGQSLANLPGYLRGAWELTVGHVDAMSLAGSPGELGLAAAILLALISIVVLAAGRAPREAARVSGAALLAAGLFLAWKYGFVRHDYHALDFFTFALLSILFLPSLVPGLRLALNPRTGVAILGVGLSLAGVLALRRRAVDPVAMMSAATSRFRDSARGFFRPASLAAELAAKRREAERRCALPAIRDRVKGDTIDAVASQGRLLPLNGLEWHPRPVFPSFMSYTPYLADWNRRFYEGPGRPAYVLFRMEAIDGRLPSTEDGPALARILHDYEPVVAEKDLVLLSRRASPSPAVPVGEAVESTARLGEEIVLPAAGESLIFARIVAPYSAWGRIKRLLLRPSRLFIRLKLAAGGDVSYRLVPGMAEAGFLVDPLLADTGDVLRLYRGEGGKRVTAFSLEPENAADYAAGARVALTRVPPPVRTPALP